MTKDEMPIDYAQKRKALIDYMRVKMDEGDWHGVSDAANDLRVLEARELGSYLNSPIPFQFGETKHE